MPVSPSPSLSPSASPSTSPSPTASPSIMIGGILLASPSAPGDKIILEDGFEILGETYIEGSVCWGHETQIEITQDLTRTFAGNWTGTGEVQGSGDAEVLALNAGEYMVSEMVHCGVGMVTLATNQYNSGDAATVYYKQGSNPDACGADSWHEYSVPFECTGYCQIKVEPVVV